MEHQTKRVEIFLNFSENPYELGRRFTERQNKFSFIPLSFSSKKLDKALVPGCGFGPYLKHIVEI